MQILCLGLSHRTAPVEVRERLSYPEAALRAALARFGCGRPSSPKEISELVILSTCNRLELYAWVPGPAPLASDGGGQRADVFAPLVDLLAETRGLKPAEFEPYLYRYSGVEAAEHLCRVAAGLDSMILGEPQILGQVAGAHEAALGQEAAGPMLSGLFRTAIQAGKRARTETAIGRNAVSASSVAVRLAESVLGELRDARVLIVGAGMMAELAVEALRARGVRRVGVVSRTMERAAELAGRWGGQAFTFERLREALANSDIVLTSTDAPHFVILPELVAEILPQRLNRPLVFVDIAVPRDVDPDIGKLAGVHCFDIDDLQSQVQDGLDGRESEIPRVEAIVREEVQRFEAWLQQMDVLPVIVGLREKAEGIRVTEVGKTLRQLPQLGEAERRRIEALSESIVSKMLHDLTLRLKAEAGNGRAAEYAKVVRELFGLEAGD